MNDILSTIIAHKREEIALQQKAVSSSLLEEQVNRIREERQPNERHSMRNALLQSPHGIIAEFKRRSPSKGWLHPDASAEEIPAGYEQAGAAALSILTDEPFFGGSLRDLRIARLHTHIPILRKDFIIDAYQLLQARVAGADAVLLIASCLTHEQCCALTTQAHQLELEVLLEIHTAEELSYITSAPEMVGINNRHLGTFITDVNNSFRIARQLQEAVQEFNLDSRPVLVSESGISQPATIRQLRQEGFRGFLIGETWMRTTHPADTLREFIPQITR